MLTTNSSRCLSVFVLLLFLHAYAYAQPSDAPLTLTAESLADGKTVELDGTVWRYHAGDDAAWAAGEFDDENWARVKSNWVGEEDFKGIEWNGRAWFRTRVHVADDLVNQPLALRVWQLGASEIYIDGKLLHRFGKIEPDADEEYNPRGLFVPVVFTRGGAHTIAVRYSFLAARDLTRGRGRWLVRNNYAPGIRLVFAAGEDAAFKLYAHARSDLLDYVFIGLLLALAFVHFLLYVFYPRERGNLFYSFFAAGLAVVMWLSRLRNTGDLSATADALADILRNDMQGVAVMSLLAFLYVEFVGRVSRVFWILLAIWLIISALHIARVIPLGSLITPAMFVVMLADCFRVIARALSNARAGAWIIAAGIGIFFVCVLNNIAIGNRFVEVPDWFRDFIENITILSVPVAVSLYLARNFARTNLNLEAQLSNVEELSAKQLEQERRESEMRVEHAATRAENERRARELEEARQLQVSMLPKRLPQLPNLEIAAYMKPASEVGGDYYDFYVAPDGTLTAVVGDATGHGLKAGTIVTAMKSLFVTHAPQDDMPHVFGESNRVLKAMNLRGLFMALLMLKVRGDRLTICTAGMPPALLYRAATAEIEAADLRAAPLGSLKNFDYREQEYAIEPGDCIVAMSDGFPERFNADGEMLGYDKARAVLAEVAGETADEIIKRFVCEGDEWAGERAQDDDVTFVVLKVKQS